MELSDILQVAVRGGASDIHLKVGLPPMFRVDGALVPLKNAQRLSGEEVSRMALGTMSEAQRAKFQQTNEVDLGFGVAGLGRFRVNVFMQRGAMGMVLRVIPVKISSVQELALPAVVEPIAKEERGLVLVTGITGSGKSTTLASMVDYINANEAGHIMTIEDPIEFLIRDKRCVVNQREVGVDTHSFGHAMKSALRQDPDVILVGEMRDLETIETALNAAETGHLVMSTLHTLDATESINRIIGAFPPHQQKQVRLQLSSVLKAVISQRLVPRADGKGRVPAVEVLRSSARVRELIEDKDRTREIHEAISQGHTSYGMQTFDQSLMSLVQKGLITMDEAKRQATNPDDFALRLAGISGTSDSKWDDFDGTAAAREADAWALQAKSRAAASATQPVPAAGQGLPRARPTVPAPAAAAAAQEQPPTRPASPSEPAAGDDFKIERF
ncbi:MAG: type IV pilus twitching motility protein PilT [Deltaproteobacteria bacterium]|nr:type IV pilus twitching motility protein PilT [Deltaproteobacteria bacterium]